MKRSQVPHASLHQTLKRMYTLHVKLRKRMKVLHMNPGQTPKTTYIFLVNNPLHMQDALQLVVKMVVKKHLVGQLYCFLMDY